MLVVCLLIYKLFHSGNSFAQSSPAFSQSAFLFFADVSTADWISGTVMPMESSGRPAANRLSFSWSQPYASKLSAQFCLTYSRRTSGGRLAVQLQEAGSGLYRKNGLSLGFFRPLGSTLSAGLLLGAELITGDEGMRVFHPMVEGWLKVRLNGKTEAGLYLARLVWMRELRSGGILLPPAFYAGIRRSLSEQFCISTELRYYAEYGFAWMTSLYARPTKGITMVAGMDFLNRHFFSGFSFPLGKTSCSFGLFYHASLGVTPASGFDFPLTFK